MIRKISLCLSRISQREASLLAVHIAAGTPPPCARADRSAIGANLGRTAVDAGLLRVRIGLRAWTDALAAISVSRFRRDRNI